MTEPAADEQEERVRSAVLWAEMGEALGSVLEMATSEGEYSTKLERILDVLWASRRTWQGRALDAEVRNANLESGRAIEQEMLRNSVPRMAAALTLHTGTEVAPEGVSPYCEVCRSPWPCDTWEALTGASDREDER